MLRPNEPIRPESETENAAELRRQRRLALLVVWVALLVTLVWTAVGSPLSRDALMEGEYRTCVRDATGIHLGNDLDFWVEDGVPFAVVHGSVDVPEAVHQDCFARLTPGGG